MRELRARGDFGLMLAPMQLLQLFGGASERIGCLRCVAAHLRPGRRGRGGDRRADAAPEDGAAAPARRPRGRRLGLLEPAGRRRRRRRRRRRPAPAQVVSPDGELTRSVDEVRLRRLSAEALEREAVGPACTGGPPRDPGHRRARRLDRRHDRKEALMELRVLALYPEQMNIYADRGNIVLLQRRCEWRGIGFAMPAAGPGERVDPGAHDLIYIGGGQDRDQRMVAADMVETKREALARGGRARRRGAGGLRRLPAARPLLPARRGAAPGPRPGRPGDGARAGTAADRQRRDRGRPRRRARACSPASRTTAGAPTWGRRAAARPRRQGHGNNGDDGLEGVRRDNLIGTYLHGPLLPKNAWLADQLIALALERRYGARPELEPLDDALEDAAHDVGAAARRAAASDGSAPAGAEAAVAAGGLGERSTSTGSASAIGAITSWAIRSPGSTSKGLAGSVFSSSTRSSPR